MSRNSKIVLAISLSTIGIILTVVMSILLIKFVNNEKTGKLNYQKDYILVNDIEVKIGYGDILIKENSNKMIKIEIYSVNEKKYKVNNSSEKITVNINNKKNGFISRLFSNKPKIIIYIPSDYSGKLDVNNAVGDVKIDSFKNLNLNSFISVGDLIVNEINSINSKVDVGDIKIDNIKEHLSITSNIGDIKINDISINKDSIIDNKIGDIKINSIKNAYIDATSNIGEVKINKNDRRSENILTIKSNIGDIKVN